MDLGSGAWADWTQGLLRVTVGLLVGDEAGQYFAKPSDRIQEHVARKLKKVSAF